MSTILTVVKKEQLEQFKQKAHIFCETISIYANKKQLRGTKALNLLSRVLGYPSYSALSIIAKGLSLQANENFVLNVINDSNAEEASKALHVELGNEFSLHESVEIVNNFKIHSSFPKSLKRYQREDLILLDYMNSKLSEEELRSMKATIDEKTESVLDGLGVNTPKPRKAGFLKNAIDFPFKILK